MRRLTPSARQRLVVRIMATPTREQLRTLEQRIARHYAATPAQRAANDAELEWLRSAALARREMVGKGGRGMS